MSNLSHLPPSVTSGTDDPALLPSTGAQESFAWPTPPYAIYATSLPQQEPEPCEIEGLNGKVMQATMLGFWPGQNVIQVLVPPARTAMPLRPSQFRRITLLTPLRPSFMDRGAVPAELMDFHPSVDYRVDLADGSTLSGRTVGHMETTEGLFLFPPLDDGGTVQRLFCPRGVYARYQLGAALGSMLVAEDTASPAQIAEVLAEQNQLRERRLGDVLLGQNVVTREQLESALETQSRMPMVRIGEALIALGYITQGQLDAALSEQRENRAVPLGELLVRAGHIQRSALRSALARKMGYPVVQLEDYPIDPIALKQVPLSVARRLNVLPLQSLPGRLVVALEDPSRTDVLDELSFLAQGKVVPVLPASDNLQQLISGAYQKHGYEEAISLSAFDPSGLSFDEAGTERLLADLEQTRTSEQETPDEPPIEQSDNTLVRLINTMIVEAQAQGASDIHIEPQPGREKLRIRFRRDGILHPYLELPHTYRNALVARIKIMCDLDISERRRPQDGKINFARFVPSCPIELRVATIPTNNGLEDVVLRLLASAKALPIDKLGLSPQNLLALKDAIGRPYGLVLCVGPTGSGKTTTLHSALSYINTPERKIWTAEDPVEITQAGLRQVQVNPKIDWTFAKALRAFLRADPDVIMVGEIRDEETASIAIESSLTGHLVLSTLHTNSAAETVTRLLDMGMDPFNFADSLLAVLAQRLVRRLCSNCRRAEPAPDEWVEELLDDYLHAWEGHTGAPDRAALKQDWIRRHGAKGVLMHYHSPGCEKCDETGLHGRAAIHELLSTSREMRQLIHSAGHAEDIEQLALSQGMRTLRQDGIEKVLAGITSLEEVRATSNTR